MKRNYNSNEIDDLNEVSILEEEESNSLPPIRLELNGITTEEELAFIRQKSTSDGHNVVPLYVIFGLDTLKICDVDLTIDLLLSLKYIGLNKYTLTLVHEDKRLEILKPDISESSIEMLLNFVRIGGLD